MATLVRPGVCACAGGLHRLRELDGPSVHIALQWFKGVTFGLLS